MERTLPALRPLPWRWLAISAYLGVNLALVLLLLSGFLTRSGTEHPDWQLWSSLPASIAAGEMYDPTRFPPFVWSPVMGWFMAAVAIIGYWPWFAAHFAAALLLRNPLLIGLTVASWGFWIDAVGGNTFGFVFIAGALALQGSRWAAVVYLGLLFLMPRPIQVPLALWLLWSMPSIRWPVAGVFAAHAVLVLASGYAGAWMGALFGMTEFGPVPVNAGNFAPSALIGAPLWMLAGVPLGAWLLWKGRVGWASLAWSPYWLPAYLIVPLWEVIRGRGESPGR